jgi:type II secretory ATPase GspE/PulE/Tfp pilus assembly ATPase PilB-like protein
VAAGCADCGQTGYNGRLVLAELLLPDQEIFGQAILARRDVHYLEQAAVAGGMVGRWERACRAVEEGLTSPAEVRRVLGVATPLRNEIGQG